MREKVSHAVCLNLTTIEKAARYLMVTLSSTCFCNISFEKMTIHSLYVFSKGGSCLYYKEWYRPRSTLSEFPEEDRKLMFGLLFSLKQLMNKMQPIPL